MERKIVSGIMLPLLLIGMLTLAFNIQPAKASGTIYIMADGSIYPPDAPILTVDNITYTFTGDIFDSIVIERDNIVVDGAGYTLQGTGPTGYKYPGIGLYGRSNVTIKNTNIKGFSQGIYLFLESSNNDIIGNNIVNNGEGVTLMYGSNYNTIYANNIANNGYGIVPFSGSSHNTIYANNITANGQGVLILSTCINNIIYANNITANGYGVRIFSSLYNKIYHNNFINNTNRVVVTPEYEDGIPIFNLWDDGYPSGGNYWSDYTGVDLYSGPYQNETGSDGIGDTPYVINVNNKDSYPFMRESGWEVPTPEQAIRDLIDVVESMNLQQGIDNSLDAKLANVLASLEAFNAEQRNDTINKLYAFINEVEAQRENKITNEQADYLIAATQKIINLIEQ